MSKTRTLSSLTGGALLCAACLALLGCERAPESTTPPAEIVFHATPTPPPRPAARGGELPCSPVPTLPAPPTPLPDNDRAVARVGENFVMLGDVLRYTAAMELHIGGQAGDGRETWEGYRGDVLDRMIEERLQEWEAEHGAERLTPEEEEAEFARFVDGMGGWQTFKEQAEQMGLSEDAMRARLARRILVQRLFQRNVGDQVDVGEERLREYYDANRTTLFRVPARVDLRRVFIGLESRSREEALALTRELHAQAQEALDVIDASYAQALAAEDGAARSTALLAQKRQERLNVMRRMAVSHSEGPASAQGGHIALYEVLLDGREEMQFDPAFVQHVYDFGQPDQLSEVLETPTGCLFYLVYRRLASRQQQFDEIRDTLREKVRREQQQDLYRAWMARLTACVGVELYPDNLAHFDLDMVQEAAKRAEAERATGGVFSAPRATRE